MTRPGIEHQHRYRLEGDGALAVENVFRVPRELADLPRVGVTLQLVAGLEALSWLGPGPHETYWDRRAGAAVGRFESTVRDQYVPYIVPQEHGNHCDVRWLELRSREAIDGEGAPGLRVESLDRHAESLFGFSASHYTAEDLTEATHTNTLEPRREVVLNIDRLQRGLGTASCGPDTLPRYRIPAGTHRLAFRLLAPH